MNQHYDILILGGGTAGLTARRSSHTRWAGIESGSSNPRRCTITSHSGHSWAVASSGARTPRARNVT